MSEYPLRLLPSDSYVLRIDRDLLMANNPYLQRKCYHPEEECCVDGDRNRLTVKAFGSSGLNNMSVNILGALFKIGDEIWYQKVTDEDVWKGGNVTIEDYEGRYEPQDVQNCVYFKFDKANSLNWTFPRTFKSVEERDMYEAAIVEGMSTGNFSGKTPYTLKAHSECHHAPNVLNYWHAEIKSIIDSNPTEEVSANDKNYKKKALRGMIEKLRPYGTLNPPSNIIDLPKDLYVKSN